MNDPNLKFNLYKITENKEKYIIINSGKVEWYRKGF